MHSLSGKILGLFSKPTQPTWSLSGRKPVELSGILDSIKKFSASSSTPRSRVNLVYNFGDAVDVIVCFAHHDRAINSFRLSKGLSKTLNRRLIKQEKITQFTPIHTKDDRPRLHLRQCSTTLQKCILLLETNDSICGMEDWEWLVSHLDAWASKNYPLVIGVDIYTIPGYLDFPALDVLNIVLKHKNLRFVFYNKGYRNLDFLQIPTPPTHAVPNPTGYMIPKTSNEFYVNSMIELRNLLINADMANAIKYRTILESALSPTNRSSAAAINLIRSRNINIYNNETQSYLIQTSIFYRMGYSLKDGYVPFDTNTQKFDTTDQYILVTENTELMLNAELTQVVSKIDLHKCQMPKITFIEGCPGSGKSQFIIQHHQPGNDLILTHTRVAVRDIRAAASRQFNLNGNKCLLQDYRTVSSYIINNKGKNYKRVFIDEVSLGHAGYIGFVAFLSGAKEIFLLGDTKQIPYIERSPIRVKFHNVAGLCTPQIYLMTTKRCPVDVSYALASQYPDIKSTNQILRSILPTLVNGEFYQLKPNTLILSFTQAEKRQIIKALDGKCQEQLQVHTIHESQGKTAEHVLLCRTNPAPLEVYSSLAHAVVAISRHTKSFQYITTNDNDSVCTFIKRARQLSDKKLKIWHDERLIEAMDIKYPQLLPSSKSGHPPVDSANA